jgi:hypothetical protein
VNTNAMAVAEAVLSIVVAADAAAAGMFLPTKRPTIFCIHSVQPGILAFFVLFCFVVFTNTPNKPNKLTDLEIAKAIADHHLQKSATRITPTPGRSKNDKVNRARAKRQHQKQQQQKQRLST